MKLTSTNDFKIQIVDTSLSGGICRKITADLPEYFGIPEANERYIIGVQERISFTAVRDDKHIG